MVLSQSFRDLSAFCSGFTFDAGRRAAGSVTVNFKGSQFPKDVML
jgi:hypothetical protein